MSERGRLPALDRLWGLTKPVPTAPVPIAPVTTAPVTIAPVPTRPTVQPRATTAPVVEQWSWAPSILPVARTILPATTATLTARDRGVPGSVPAGTADGWVPARDADASALDTNRSACDTDRSACDAADVAARRTSALAAASKAYADLHGHPLTHPSAGERRPRDAPQRWAVPMRLALTAAVALGLVGGAIALRSASVASAGLIPIELPPVGVSLASPAAGTDDAVGAAPTDSASAGDAGPASVLTSSGGTVVVHVVGEVASPGVVELAAGSRVDDAISAAGGATTRADLAALNLARVVIDGEQVVVPEPGDDLAPQAGAQLGGRTAAEAVGSGGSASGTVDLNGADAAALDALPGIGPVLAGRIVDWRQANRRFTSIDQLGEVDGIGPTLLAKLRPLVRV